MDISRVILNAFTPRKSGICAEVTVIFDNVLAVHKIFVIQGDRGLFVAMPNTGQTKMVNGKKKFDDIVHALDKHLTEDISKRVLEVYNAKVEEHKSKGKLNIL